MTAIPESIIMSVLPFSNPETEAQRAINDRAEAMYLDDWARENFQGATGFVQLDDEDLDHVYYTVFGWTAEGWRSMVTVIDADQFSQLEGITLEFSSKMAQLTKARLLKDLGVEDTGNPREIAEKLFAALKARPDCGDPKCPIHGPQGGPESLSVIFDDVLGAMEQVVPGGGIRVINASDLDDFFGNLM